MASVYITSNQLTGATNSKAVYRILGTLIGAAGTIILVPNLVNAPELLSLAIALWVGICLYLALIDGTPRSYVFMLAGYTVALLGFPVVSAPQSTFDIVVSRVQEIMLGIICASVVAMLVLPRSVASAVTAQADAWLAGARRLGADVLTGRGSEQERDDERIRLAAVASEIDQLGRHLGYEAAFRKYRARPAAPPAAYAVAASAARLDRGPQARARLARGSVGACCRDLRKDSAVARSRRPRRTGSRCAARGARRNPTGAGRRMPAGPISWSPASLSGCATSSISCRIASSCARRSPRSQSGAASARLHA